MSGMSSVCTFKAVFPWEEGVATAESPIWRFSGNPIIGRNPLPVAARIYNSAVVPFGEGFVGVFRADYRTGMPVLHLGRSVDGVCWEFEGKPLGFRSGAEGEGLVYAYDPRVCRVGEDYLVTWCNGYHGPTIGIARTRDFVGFEQLENAFIPCNRNGVLFPRRINGNYAMLSRPSDQGHTPFGDIFYSESPDLTYWGRHRFVMGAGPEWWQDHKIGAGPVPIETEEGWLVLYHGVCRTCNGLVYSIGVALLDLEQPWRVICRSRQFALAPELSYETSGFVPNVLFPCAMLHDVRTGRLAIYYGAADTVTALAFSRVGLLLDFVREYAQC
jgi:beta-1,4-mannooligosaccharide/beta-1,4-mannosyl-N-acetylglucosamine phosphorylase